MNGKLASKILHWIPAYAGMTALLTLSIIITGCGFHLRGAFALPKYLQTIYITPDDPYESFQKTLRHTLQQNNVQIVSSPSKEAVVLELTTPDFSESVLAFDPYGQPQRFKLIINFQYQVSYNHKILRPFTSIQSSRDITLPANQVLSNENERRINKEDLLQDAINKLLQQLSTIPAP